MKRPMPKVQEFMTRSPKTMVAETPLETVQCLMKEWGIRHFPVEKQGTLVGIVSDRNVKAALLSPEGKSFSAEDVMVPEPYVVPPDVDLDLVVSAMAEEKFGCAIVQEGDGKVVGIFTTVDACRAFCQILETNYPS